MLTRKTNLLWCNSLGFKIHFDHAHYTLEVQNFLKKISEINWLKINYFFSTKNFKIVLLIKKKYLNNVK